jgi:hypothetical protein
MQRSDHTLPSVLKMLAVLNPFRKLTALQCAARDLEKSLLSRLEAISERERYTHMVRMYDERISRLRMEIATMTKEQDNA